MPATLTDVDREEALRRFPEARDIRDSHLREQVLDIIQRFPDYFWTAPASSSHHPPEHRKRHGLWLHTKRVCTAFERTAQSMVNQGHLSWDEIDRGRAACILHDMFKFGLPPTEVKDTTDDHDIVAANWLEEHTDIHSDVVGAVAAHNGPWYQGPPPRSHLEQIVHIADMHASDEDVRIAVKDPHEILQQQFPRVSER